MKMDDFIDFLRHLDKHNIPYDIDRTGDDYVMVNIDIPGERWEVNFSDDGEVAAERFGNMGDVAGQEIMDYLYDNYSI